MASEQGASENGTAGGAGEELGTELSRLSGEAFALATAAAQSRDFAAGEGRARALSDRLGELWPRVEAAPPAERAGLERYWSDARLDLGYVLSGGELSPSVRLYHALQDRSET